MARVGGTTKETKFTKGAMLVIALSPVLVFSESMLGSANRGDAPVTRQCDSVVASPLFLE